MTQESKGSGVEHAGEQFRRELAVALSNDEFFLVYQPSIDLQTNGFAGVETLLRWRHPSEGVLAPDRFMAELEASGLLIAVGRWTVLTACLQGAAWHAKGYRFSVSVNVAATQFEHPDFTADVEYALDVSRFDPALLVLEFSQATLTASPETSAQYLRELKDLGVRVAIDDFEPDHADLSELAGLPIDIVKLDRAFVARLHDVPETADQVHHLVEVARERGLQIVASGIEDDEQRRQLQLENVTAGQGFHFSRPHEAADIDRFLEDFSIFSGRPL